MIAQAKPRRPKLTAKHQQQFEGMLPVVVRVARQSFSHLDPEAKENDNPARFMIHAGDQIYFDFPFTARPPDAAEYRKTYRQAWFEDSKLRELLARCPHYMTLDDHDVVECVL